MKQLNPIEKAVQYAQDMGDKYREDIREYLADMPYGTQKATPEQDQEFVQLMISQNLPQWWVFPDGHEEFNSSWVIALREGYIEELHSAWRGVKEALESIGPLPMPIDTMGLAGAVAPMVPPAVAPPPPIVPPGSSPMQSRFLQRPNIPPGVA